jgi:hypothetical protein
MINQIYEQYEFRDYLITIENWFGTNKLEAFAVQKKISHLLDKHTCMIEDVDEILKKHGFDFYEDADNELLKENEVEPYFIFEPDDAVMELHCNVNKSWSVLEYVIEWLNQHYINRHNCPDSIISVSFSRGNKQPEKLIVREISKKNVYPKSTPRQRGFNQVAWSAMVRLRDKQCKECGSEYELHAHHIKPYKDNPKLRYDVNNGITLCAICHRKWHQENGK